MSLTWPSLLRRKGLRLDKSVCVILFLFSTSGGCGSKQWIRSQHRASGKREAAIRTWTSLVHMSFFLGGGGFSQKQTKEKVIAKGGVRTDYKGGWKRFSCLSTFVRVCLRFLAFSQLRLIAFVDVCLHLFSFARICLHPPLSRPPLRASSSRVGKVFGWDPRTTKLRIWTLRIWCLRAQDSVLRGRCSVERRHAYFWSDFSARRQCFCLFTVCCGAY